MRGLARRDLMIVAVIAAASLLVRAAFAFRTDIFQDEAIYWWQVHESLSFSPHPPAAPLAMRLGLALFGRSVAAIRVGSLLAGTLSIFMAYVLGRAMRGGRAGVWAAALFALCPLFAAVGGVAGPDALLLLVWLVFVYAAWRAAREQTAFWWTAVGVLFAAGLYTKYMMVLAGPSLGLALLLSKEDRPLLKRAGPWLAGLLGVGLFAPALLVWDWVHGWPTLRYHLAARHIWMVEWRQVEGYVLWHLAAISPLLVAGVFWALVHWSLWRRRRERTGIWMACFGWLPIAFFLVPSVFTHSTMSRVQWDAIGYLAGVLAFAFLLRERGVRGRVLRRRRRFALAAMVLAGVTVLAAAVVMVWPALFAEVGLKPLGTRLIGWSEVADRVRQEQKGWRGPTRFIVGDSFRTALCISFHLDVRTDVYTLFHMSNRRYGMAEELERWGIDEPAMLRTRRGQDALYVHEYHFSRHAQAEDPPERIYRFFSDVRKVGDVYIVRGGRQLRHFGLFDCRNLTTKPGVHGTR